MYIVYTHHVYNDIRVKGASWTHAGDKIRFTYIYICIAPHTAENKVVLEDFEDIFFFLRQPRHVLAASSTRCVEWQMHQIVIFDKCVNNVLLIPSAAKRFGRILCEFLFPIICTRALPYLPLLCCSFIIIICNYYKMNNDVEIQIPRQTNCWRRVSV